jgi:GH25 family lysozyme M1 (1,4-beta-N-acetylmuramidase)
MKTSYFCRLLACISILAAASSARAQRSLGIDVSDWQGTLTINNWTKIHQPASSGGGGRDFVFLRSTRGGTTGFYDEHDAPNKNGLNTLSQRYDDLQFYDNILNATAVGMLTGPYHFGRPDIISSTQNSGGIANTGTDEANHMLSISGRYMRPGYLLPVYDNEAGASQRTPDQLAQFINDFGQTIFNAKGVFPIVYASTSYASDPATSGNQSGYIRPSVALKMPNLWLARWPNQSNPNSIDVQNIDPPAASGYPNVYGVWNPTYPTIPSPQPWKFWQYASSGYVPISSTGSLNIDTDVAHGDIEFVKDYLVPALWTVDADGQWTTMSNWNSGVDQSSWVDNNGTAHFDAGLAARLPGANDTVQLNRPTGNFLVTLSSGTQSIRRLFSFERLSINGGSLIVSRAAQFDNTATLVSGRFNAGSLTINNTQGGGYNQLGGVTLVSGPVMGNGTFNATAGSFTAQSIRGVTMFIAGTGSVTISANGGSIATSNVPVLAISGSGKFNLNDNDLVINYNAGTPFTQIKNYITTGYTSGSWNGIGINSSAAAAARNSAHITALGYAEATDIGSPATFSGQTIDATSILVRYTAAGDADLNGSVELNDFSALAANFNATGKRWTQGDFNYDGSVDLSDFTLLAANFNYTLPGSSTSVGAVVPEPACGLVVAVGAAIGVTRRRGR